MDRIGRLKSTRFQNSSNMKPITRSRPRRHARLKVNKQPSMEEVNLPEHIIHQIFLRMPTKPLVRLKCLSKHWNRVISDPNFMKSRSKRMIFLPTVTKLYAIDNTTVTGDPFMIKLCSPFRMDAYEEITVVGSFNGIVLLDFKFIRMILHNPFSGEFKMLPPFRDFDSLCNYVFGFGYGATEDDLKIVRLRDFCHFDNSNSLQVFSLKAWSWSKPSKFVGDYCFKGSYSGTFANGFMYWNVIRKTNQLPLILALDMKKMVFSEIDIPDGRCLIRLGTNNGRIYMVCSQSDSLEYELRILNGESWSIICSFTSAFRAQCILDDGKLLMSYMSQQLFIYDMFKDSYENVDTLLSFTQVSRLQAVEYVESSVSLSDICYV